MMHKISAYIRISPMYAERQNFDGFMANSQKLWLKYG